MASQKSQQNAQPAAAPPSGATEPLAQENETRRRGRKAGGRKNGEGTYDVESSGLHRYRQWYTGPDGRSAQKVIRASTPKGLRAKVKAWQEELARGLATDGENPELETVVDRWLGTKVDLRANSLLDYSQIAGRIKAGLGGHKVKALTDSHIQAWINAERKAGRAASTLIKTKALLHQILSYAEQRGYIVRNVARLVRVPKRDQVDPEVYSRAQMDALLAAARPQRLQGQMGRPPADWYALLAVECWTGLRPSELLGLRWTDVRWDSGVIYAQRGLLWPDDAPEPKLSPMKNAYSRRDIPVPAYVLDALRDHREAQHELREALQEGYDDWGLIFAQTQGTRTGGPMRERDVARAFAGVCRRAGLPSIPFYNLRHSYATSLLDEGVPLHVVSGLLGHASIKITADIYGARSKRNTTVAAAYIARLTPSAPVALPAPAQNAVLAAAGA